MAVAGSASSFRVSLHLYLPPQVWLGVSPLPCRFCSLGDFGVLRTFGRNEFKCDGQYIGWPRRVCVVSWAEGSSAAKRI